MKMIFSINKQKPPKSQKNQNIIKPQIVDNETIVPESFKFFKKTAMFKQILLPYNCGNCYK
jgi:hypothetical protein